MADTTELMKYLIAETEDRGLPLLKTALVKLLYLADIDSVRRGYPRISRVVWIFYKYGPYAFEIEDALREIAGREIDESDRVSTRGRRYQVYKTRDSTSARLSPEEKGVLNSVIDRWAGLSLEHLLNYVYFETEPMQVAVWEKPLDFGQIRPQRKVAGSLADTVGPRMSSDEIGRLSELKKAFWTAIRSEEDKRVEPTPPPRIDEVFLLGMRTSDEVG